MDRGSISLRFLVPRAARWPPRIYCIGGCDIGTPGLEPAARFYGSRFLPFGKMFRIPQPGWDTRLERGRSRRPVCLWLLLYCNTTFPTKATFLLYSGLFQIFISNMQPRIVRTIGISSLRSYLLPCHPIQIEHLKHAPGLPILNSIDPFLDSLAFGFFLVQYLLPPVI